MTEEPRDVTEETPPACHEEAPPYTPLQPNREHAVIDDEQPESRPEETWKNSLYSRGVAEFVLGFVSVVLGLLSINSAGLNRFSVTDRGTTLYEYNHEATYRGQGIWGGSYLVVCGIVAISAKINPTYLVYQANKVLSFLGIFVMLSFAILSADAAAKVPRHMKTLIAIHGVLSAIGFACTALCMSHTCAVCCHMPESQRKLR